ncbi:hypothetical protein U91I_00822 [alpha proteobacterium U9-1i]|nr:hypothetical protein U91I_00822 [alpha proteobacterium U9-1i]
MLKTILAAFAMCAWLGASAAAQTSERGQAASPPSAAVGQIEIASWLAGRWVGEGLGGVIEETWSSAAGGQMVGHFRLVRDGAPEFYELMLLDVTEAGLRLRLKHFNPDFTGWEEKDGWHSFEPVSASANELAFQGLRLRRISDTEAEFVVTIRYPDGAREQILRLTRAPL